MKKLINNPQDVVKEMLQGMIASNQNLKLCVEEDVIIRKNLTKKVTLVSGGGSGHEPAHAGFVGFGMLDAAVCGAVFTSPTPFQVYKAIEEVNQGMGVLLVIKNYTGDVLNFEMAMDMAKDNNIKVASVLVDDDIAVEDSLYTVGKRGVAGTILVHKIAGALAEKGESLESIQRIATDVVANMATMGLSLGPCIVPASGKPSFELAENEMEVGLGIHGEPGVYRDKIKTAKESAELLLNKVINHLKLSSGEEVCLLVNGLGGTPMMELSIMNNEFHKILKAKNIKVIKNLVGNYMTSLEMPGISVSLLRMKNEFKEPLLAKANTDFYKEF
ncbi:MAG: dihydroxyacetone kinase subunit DhaK [Alphaproteobacteria bacterium]|jgi:dihydroxyacetone kinase-like protein|nr:dihydroxyacetone kinase subunit DhaK [Alphaproteobacteria bacterium]